MSYAAQSKPRISAGEFWALPTIFALMLSGGIGLIVFGAGLGTALTSRPITCECLVIFSFGASQLMTLATPFHDTSCRVGGGTDSSPKAQVIIVSGILSAIGATVGTIIAVGIMSYA